MNIEKLLTAPKFLFAWTFRCCNSNSKECRSVRQWCLPSMQKISLKGKHQTWTKWRSKPTTNIRLSWINEYPFPNNQTWPLPHHIDIKVKILYVNQKCCVSNMTHNTHKHPLLPWYVCALCQRFAMVITSLNPCASGCAHKPWSTMMMCTLTMVRNGCTPLTHHDHSNNYKSSAFFCISNTFSTIIAMHGLSLAHRCGGAQRCCKPLGPWWHLSCSINTKGVLTISTSQIQCIGTPTN